MSEFPALNPGPQRLAIEGPRHEQPAASLPAPEGQPVLTGGAPEAAPADRPGMAVWAEQAQTEDALQSPLGAPYLKFEASKIPPGASESAMRASPEASQARVRSMMGQAAGVLRNLRDRSLLAARGGLTRVKAAKGTVANAVVNGARTGLEAAQNTLVDAGQRYGEWAEKRNEKLGDLAGALAVSGTVLFDEIKSSARPDKPLMYADIKKTYREWKERRRQTIATIAGTLVMRDAVLRGGIGLQAGPQTASGHEA